MAAPANTPHPAAPGVPPFPVEKPLAPGDN